MGCVSPDVASLEPSLGKFCHIIQKLVLSVPETTHIVLKRSGTRHKHHALHGFELLCYAVHAFLLHCTATKTLGESRPRLRIDSRAQIRTRSMDTLAPVGVKYDDRTVPVPPITSIFRRNRPVRGSEVHRPNLRHQTPEREAASRRFAGMTSASKSKPASTKLRYWRVSVPGRKRPEYVGIVEAPARQAAEATAVQRVTVTQEERGRIVVRKRD